MYLQGNGVEKDDVEAVKWFRLAAEQGNADAQNQLGDMYANGHGVEADDVEAVKWYRLAAEQGDADAQNQLGHMYANGRGVEEDDVEAVKWFRLAAEQGYAIGQFNLGDFYANGYGVEQDDAEAVKWYRLAAEQGDEDAQRSLARLDPQRPRSEGETTIVETKARKEIRIAVEYVIEHARSHWAMLETDDGWVQILDYTINCYYPHKESPEILYPELINHPIIAELEDFVEDAYMMVNLNEMNQSEIVLWIEQYFAKVISVDLTTSKITHYTEDPS